MISAIHNRVRVSNTDMTFLLALVTSFILIGVPTVCWGCCICNSGAWGGKAIPTSLLLRMDVREELVVSTWPCGLVLHNDNI